MSVAPSVVFVLPDKLGGAFTATANVIANRPPDALRCHLVLTHNRSSREPRSFELPSAESRSVVEHALPDENLWAVLRRIARAVPSGPGVIVTSDLLDVAATSVHDFGRAVVMFVHGSSDYYFDLAATHERTLHAFIACSAYIAARLRERLPHRADTIFEIPHGVPPARAVRRPATGPLRAAFIGRIDVNKGVLSLPRIDAAARARGAAVQWTIVGDGPLTNRLRNEWADSVAVRWLGPLTPDRTLEMLADQDLFVLPTRSEGFPIALLEAMNAGLVPVVSDMPSGIPELVESGVNGFRVPADEPEAFADRMVVLDGNRQLLEACSARARQTVAAAFPIDRCVERHFAVYGRYRELYRPLGPAPRLQYGSRLDRRWIPNSVVRAIRRASARPRRDTA